MNLILDSRYVRVLTWDLGGLASSHSGGRQRLFRQRLVALGGVATMERKGVLDLSTRSHHLAFRPSGASGCWWRGIIGDLLSNGSHVYGVSLSAIPRIEPIWLYVVGQFGANHALGVGKNGIGVGAVGLRLLAVGLRLLAVGL